MSDKDKTKLRFFELYLKWKALIMDPKIRISSRSQDYVNNEPYRSIVKIGESVLPYIIIGLENGEFFFNHAFIELTGVNLSKLITEVNPFPSEQEKSKLLLMWWEKQDNTARARGI